MSTPFDEVIARITSSGYHNHRLEEHSDLASTGVFADLVNHCAALRTDVDGKVVKGWLNVRAPGARERKIDLFIGELGKPNIDRFLVRVENKSVITAHRNRDARFDDLNETMQVVHGVKQEAVIVATIFVGVARDEMPKAA